MMNCSENTRIATQKAKKNRWFRRMFTVALLVGLAIGFLLGAFTVLMLECSAEEPNQEPSQSTEVQPTQSVIPMPEVTVVVSFLLGIAAGILIHRLLMAFVLWTVPNTRCAYCRWLKKDKGRHKE